MKIKIIKESKKASSNKQILNENPLIATLVAALRPILLDAVTSGGKENAGENAEELIKLARSSPVTTQSKDTMDIKKILQAIQAQLANIDISVDTVATGAAQGQDPEELDKAQKKTGRAITDFDVDTSPADEVPGKLDQFRKSIGTAAGRLGSAASKVASKIK